MAEEHAPNDRRARGGRGRRLSLRDGRVGAGRLTGLSAERRLDEFGDRGAKSNGGDRGDDQDRADADPGDGPSRAHLGIIHRPEELGESVSLANGLKEADREREEAHLQTVHAGAEGRDFEAADLSPDRRGSAGAERARRACCPAALIQRWPALTSLEGAPAYNVGRAYAAFAADMDNGTHTVPDFADAVRRHEVIAAIERSAASGERVKA